MGWFRKNKATIGLIFSVIVNILQTVGVLPPAVEAEPAPVLGE